jgi:hypothetical protein
MQGSGVGVSNEKYVRLLVSRLAWKIRMFRILRSMQFVLARFYQNVGEIVHERYEARRSFQLTRFV